MEIEQRGGDLISYLGRALMTIWMPF